MAQRSLSIQLALLATIATVALVVLGACTATRPSLKANIANGAKKVPLEASLQVISTIGVEGFPVTLAVNPATDRIYIGSGLIYRISPKGEGFVLYGAPKREITSLALDSAGNIYVAAAGEKRSGGGSPSLPQRGRR